ncbi:MAG: branched-chain amino acid ABC transporter permease [Candidatus Tectomicrobia bacterium]|nr:branched-chain amino acid ABC transporter permease [Candidatus Tectomicrobia bacterium]
MKKLTLVGAILIVLYFAMVPIISDSTYSMSALLIFFLYIVLAQSYDLVGGHLGYMNLGHSSFFGLGAYVFSILSLRAAPGSVSVLAAVAAVVIFSLLISYPFFRLRGAYFALAMFGVILLFERLAFNLEGLTQGTAGISLPLPPAGSSAFSMNYLVSSYYLGLLLTVGTLVAWAILTNSKFGLALHSIREDEEVAETFGINSYRYKTAALALSGIPAALMGCIFAWSQKYIHPESVFGLEITLFPIAMAMLGGTGAIFGPLVGAIFLTGVEDIIWTNVQAEYGKLTAYGIVLIIVAIAMPHGMIRTRLLQRPLRFLGLGWLAT